jgi:hypothetical protein
MVMPRALILTNPGSRITLIMSRIQLLLGRTVGSINRIGERDGSKVEIKWLPEPASGTYNSAKTFLELMYKPKKARRWVKRLKKPVYLNTQRKTSSERRQSIAAAGARFS